ncbi:MAG: polysaccharide biosynthesis protein [Bacteroidales bacterium]|nr:polysaccharide biosynthesis protein [Bacteroidales bacterium]
MMKKLLHWALGKYTTQTASRWSVLAIDLITLVIAFAITDLFRLRYGHISDWTPLFVKLAAFIAIATLFYIIVGTHRGIIRHSGLHDVYKILISNIAAAGVLILFNIVNVNHIIVTERFAPAYSEILTTFAMQAIAMLTVRLMLQRIYNEYVMEPRPTENIMLYGAGAAAEIVMNALAHDKKTNYKVLAVVDDDKKKKDTAFQGVHVYSHNSVMNAEFISKNHIETLIIAIANLRTDHKQAISNKALELGLKVKAVPHIDNWINNDFSVNQLQDIKIEDLLGRESIKTDNINIVREVVDKVVLVTGAAGSIGSEICRQLIQYKPSKIIMLDQAESPMYDLQFELKNNEPYRNEVDRMEFVITNIKDKLRMEQVFSTFKPQIVYHAAAYKHVPFMEENVYEALFVNVFGTRNVADLAIKYGAQKFVMISTDKAVNPTNVMGATKRMAEIYIQSRSTDTTHFVTTRFGNVLGSNGSVIPLFKKQLASGGPLTVTHKDIIRYFMTIPEACNLVLEAGAMGQGGDIFVFDMGKPVKIYDLAKRMIQLSGLKDIQIKEIGLRPGEKLYEELLATKENTINTHHPKIMRAEVRKYPLEDIDRQYNELWEMMATLDDMKLVGKMKSIVPEFKSNNSIYCQLDKKDE